MKNRTAIIAIIGLTLMGAATGSAQFTIKLPEISINGKRTKNNDQPTNVKENGKTGVTREQPKTVNAKFVYPPQRPNGTPMLVKNSLSIQAVTHHEYWKMPNQKNYSSWVPRLRFDHFYNNEKSLNYSVEYFNPDGSPRYSEKLEQSGTQDAERCVLFQSPRPRGGVIDTKSTAATGLFGFKITNDDTKEVLYQGKFKVGKFSTSHDPAREKNKADFYVEHDWLIPFGMVGFHHAINESGGMPLLVSFWMKGAVEPSELEGRIYFEGKQIATTANGGGGVGNDEDRRSEYAAAFAADKTWKRMRFQWNDFLFDNNGTFNRDNFPNAFYGDKNPGSYTVKVFRNGAQIREMNFTIGADGRIVAPAYSSQAFMPYYRLFIPAKVVGSEKWGVNDWKTDAFYGNPLQGFAAQ